MKEKGEYKMKNESVLKGNAFFEKYIRKHFFKYMLVLVIYAIGFIVGIGFFNHTIMEPEESEQIFQFVNNGIETLSIETSDIIANYIKEDFLEFLIMAVLSFSFIGIPIMFLLLFIKSFSLGVTVSALIHVSGAGYGMSFSILVFMIPIMLKILIALILICSSVKLLENLLRYQKEMKYEIIRHACSLFITFLILCGLILYRVFSLNIVNHILI